MVTAHSLSNFRGRFAAWLSFSFFCVCFFCNKGRFIDYIFYTPLCVETQPFLRAAQPVLDNARGVGFGSNLRNGFWGWGRWWGLAEPGLRSSPRLWEGEGTAAAAGCARAGDLVSPGDPARLLPLFVPGPVGKPRSSEGGVGDKTRL